ncbi:MAG: nuclear transport factor 2 family protein [Pseudomonadota bacterium]|jgi:ketosteroid isomerase-like protein
MATFSSAQVASTMHQALEQCDVDMLLSCYSDDAEIQIIDRNNPPSSPLMLHGKKAIADYYRDICSRGMKHVVQQEIVGDNRLGLTEACQYTDGTRVLAAEMCELRDGKIARQTNIQAWDETSVWEETEA